MRRSDQREDEEKQPFNRDHPEQYPTERKSILDIHEAEQSVDAIPMEDLRLEKQEEQEKDKTKSSSSSERKYKPES
ncbi:hypothetical protein [Paenibacillus massiliensis]|uniref:hypothetical protein n=1 Tax=Paenibacillus massiliensis TaxID=225917 RepID=UPI000405C061|nr:hypothetical protein [Paenibacillus massiliensis]